MDPSSAASCLPLVEWRRLRSEAQLKTFLQEKPLSHGL